MANLTVRKDSGTIAPRMQEWDRFARELLRFDPFRELTTFGPMLEPASVFAPAFEVKETKDAYQFKADLPGVKESDVDITRTGNRLTISGKREAEREDGNDTYYTYERTYGSFTRSFTMPEGIDEEHIHAELKDGVLSVAVPKKPEAQPKKISLKHLFEKKS